MSDSIVLLPKEFSLRLNWGDVMVEGEYISDIPGIEGMVRFSIYKFLTKSDNFPVSSFKSEQHFNIKVKAFHTYDDFEDFIAKVIEEYRNNYDFEFMVGEADKKKGISYEKK